MFGLQFDLPPARAALIPDKYAAKQPKLVRREGAI
jgi:hypothetical protein